MHPCLSDVSNIDLVFSDITMPDMTGDKMAEKMLDVRPDLPIIICTGFSRRISHKRAAEIGIKKVITKPIVVEKLAHLIREVIDSVAMKS